ncbi:MAG TPA: YfiR family protein, partial [Planctomycetota bacterium]|nr:YfiR family protein [Planctomycetota bacterium]
MKPFRMQSRVLPASVLLLGICLAAPGSAAVESRQDPGPSLPEYVLKAGFIFNFAKYVEWPAASFETPGTPISVGIVGADPFGEEIDKVLGVKTVKDRHFVILRFREAAELQRCHILFIPRSEKAHLHEILKQVDSWPVLTVGEDEGFARTGCAVNILIEKEKPRLEVNPEAAEK